ncbi:MAG: hypothetical protein ACUVWB_14415 [Anaerolineae bacterium]
MNAGKPRPHFAHPSEEEFARILDFYGIEWEYEPHTFPLEWDENGQVLEAFTPDFYLPQQGLYVELTTLRPELVTQKNRKLRRLRELYPDVHIKLFKRRDIRELLVKYGLEQEAERIQGHTAQRPNGGEGGEK